MRAFFLRHAKAVDRFPDESRELSAEGIEDANKVGRFLRRIGVTFDRAYSSTYLRARETSEIVLGYTQRNHEIELEAVSEMTNECPDEDFWKWFRTVPKVENILLVGHLPSIESRLIRSLGAEGFNVKMNPGSLACVEMDGGWGQLMFHVAPKILLD